jgi:hypothetical protein
MSSINKKRELGLMTEDKARAALIPPNYNDKARAALNPPNYNDIPVPNKIKPVPHFTDDIFVLAELLS